MELQQLRYLISVADLGNFTRASESCGVSQPSLSQQIINLEKEVGHKLFHRLGRKAVPTEAGKAFLDRARRIMLEVDSASKELSDSPSLERVITVGAIPTLAPYLLPKLLTRCKSRHQNLQINIHENFRSSLLKEVLDGEIDLALVSAPVEHPQIHASPLFREGLVLAVGKSHPLASRPKVTATDLAPETFVILGSSSTLASQVRSFCGDHHFEPKIGYRCSQVSTVKALVGLGVGISILPEIARSAEDEPLIAYIKLSDADPFRELAVIRHLQRYQSRGAEQFLGVLRDMVAATHAAQVPKG